MKPCNEDQFFELSVKKNETESHFNYLMIVCISMTYASPIETFLDEKDHFYFDFIFNFKNDARHRVYFLQETFS